MLTEERKTVFSNIGKLLPDLFAVFELQGLELVYLNPAGRNRMVPNGAMVAEKLTISDFIGMNDTDRFHREIFVQLRVLGSWTGLLSLRDMVGSEFLSQVKLIEVPGSDQSNRHMYLYAELSPAKEQTQHNTVTDEDMLHALLDTAINSIYFKDIASRYLRISRAKADKHGIADPRDSIGKTDFDYFTVDHAAPAFRDEQQIIKTGLPIIDLEEKETFSDGSIAWVSTTKQPFYNRAGKLIGTFGISRDITKQKTVEERLRMLSRAVEQSPVSIVITDKQGQIEYVNPYCEKITGYSVSEMIGQTPRVLKSGAQSAEFYQELWGTIISGKEWVGELQNQRKNGEAYWEQATISGIRDQAGQITHFIAVKEDITERKKTEAARLALETQSQLSQKLQSVGMLAAGVAHEINTPTQYITDNIRFLSESFQQLFNVLTYYRTQTAEHPELLQILKEMPAIEKENELEYLIGEIPRSLEQSLEGLGRISRIVSSLKEFSHPNAALKSGTDLNKAIETTVAVSRHEWKYVADVVTEFDPKMPQVECNLDEFNQAVLNLVINAAHAIDDAIKHFAVVRGTITIRTRHEPGWAVVEVSDTGTGIKPEVRDRIFDPFFTTKGVGKGTGQGLAIVQAVVVKGHGGRVDFTTEIGKGTTFRIFLPIAASQENPGSTPNNQSPTEHLP